MPPALHTLDSPYLRHHCRTQLYARPRPPKPSFGELRLGRPSSAAVPTSAVQYPINRSSQQRAQSTFPVANVQDWAWLQTWATEEHAAQSWHWLAFVTPPYGGTLSWLSKCGHVYATPAKWKLLQTNVTVAPNSFPATCGRLRRLTI